MTENNKVMSTHIQRVAIVYIRQSTASQVEHNRESTERQYALVSRAIELGWQREQVIVIDEDLGLSGSGSVQRVGFTRLTSEVALGHAGIVLGLEVSRLARNNADWYRLLDLCSMTNTLIGDADGIYHPASFNDRLVLGLKGTMSEAELHTLRARLNGGIRNKAARGELRRALPVGFVWGEEDGEILLHPDEALRAAVSSVFERFTELGSVRRVWLWFCSEGLSFPSQYHRKEVIWGKPTYTALCNILNNPVYAGAYTYGKSRHERVLDEHGCIKKRVRHLPREEWAVLIHDHHQGYIDWTAYEANRARIGTNIRPQPHQAGGAVREGKALLQGIATCGHCARQLRTHYRGKNNSPGYHCAGKDIVNGRGVYCLNVGGMQIDKAVSNAVLDALTPAALEATCRAVQQVESGHDAALTQWRLAVERARYEAERAQRRYQSVEPENRLVARGLEAQWEHCLRELDQAQAELSRRERVRPRELSLDERRQIQSLGADLRLVWNASTTTERDRKEILRGLLEEVIISVERTAFLAHLTIRWRGGVVTEIKVNLPRSNPAHNRTDEDTVELVRRLAALYPDTIIAGILNRQQRTTGTGKRFTANDVGNLRRHRGIARFDPPAHPPSGELVSIIKAASALNVAASTLHRWLAEGLIAGEQITPGAPWQIRLTDELRARFVAQAPAGYVPMIDATRLLGVSRQTVIQRIRRGELDAVHIVHGRRKGLRIKVADTGPDLFTQSS